MGLPTDHHFPLSLFLNFFHHREEPQKTVQHNLFPSVIHELRTPLNAILSYSEILQQDTQDSNRKEYLREIDQAVLDLSELINDLLDVSAVNSGNFSIDLSREIDVVDVIKRSVRLNYGYALRRHIEIKSDIADLKPIKLDAKRMKQVLTNLLSNAIKYSPEKSVITVSAKSENDSLLITIRDHGFGMTEDQIITAFNRYQTFSNPNSVNVDSFGLGLAIVKELVDGQKGKIEIKSKIGEGTEVGLRF